MGGTVLAKDCSQLYEARYTESGVYKVCISNAGQAIPISVFCDMETDRGGWLVFQKRQDGSVIFYKGWTSYTEGFRNITGEFWLGLYSAVVMNRANADIEMCKSSNELLHLLTDQKPQQLLADLHDHVEHTAYAMYDHFYVNPQTSKFALNISGYSGTAGNSMAHHNNQMFSTKDQDNDLAGGSCARSHFGVWWYGACHQSNLNGLYAQTGSHKMTVSADYANWKTWRGYDYSLKFTVMKIRPQNF